VRAFFDRKGEIETDVKTSVLGAFGAKLEALP
jgi:hypothetical protein